MPNTTTHSWNFQFTEGYQHVNPQTSEFYAWAVCDGDVAAVPEPGSLVLVRVWYKQPLITPLMSQALSRLKDDNALLVSTAAFRNEPYAPTS